MLFVLHPIYNNCVYVTYILDYKVTQHHHCTEHQSCCFLNLRISEKTIKTCPDYCCFFSFIQMGISIFAHSVHTV